MGLWEGIEAEEAHLKAKVAVANDKRHGTTQRRPREVWAQEEASTLKPLPAVAYEIEQYHEGQVRQDGYVRFDSRYYAAGEGLIGKMVTVIANSRQVALYHEGRLLELYERLRGAQHMKAAKPHHLKPWERTIQDGSFYCERAEKLGPRVRAWVEEVLRQGQGFVDTRKVWGVLSLDKRYGAVDIDAACGRALELGSTSFQMVARLLEQSAALKKIQAESSSAPNMPAAAGMVPYRYARPLAEYQNLLPLWRQQKEAGNA
jgi:hypothetical protein